MKKTWIIVLVVVAVIAAGALLFVQLGARRRAAQASALKTVTAEKGSLEASIGATGTVRSNQSAQLAWQTSGTVGAVKAAVGDTVTNGTELASLAASSLPQNVILAQADLVTARKNLDDLKNSTLQQAQAQQAVDDAQKALDDLQTPQLTQAQAQQALATAQKAVEDAQRQVVNSQSPATQSYIDDAQAKVVLAKDKLDKAREDFTPYANKPEDNLTRAQLQSKLAAAQQQYDAAVRNLNSLTGTASATDQSIAQANLEKAQAQLEQAQRDWERVKGGPTSTEIALAQAKLDDAKRNLERVKNGPAPDDLAAAQARVDAAQAALNQAHLTAPFDGKITDVSITPGDQVNPGTAAFRLDDLSRLLVDVMVSEVDINQAQPGQDVSLTFDSILGKEYHGKVVDVASVGQTQQGTVNFKVTVELADADQQVKPGMTAAVNIIVSQLSDVLLVPNSAVRSQDNKRVVYILKNGTSTPVDVTLGKSSDTESEVVSGGLQPGDQIVLNPPTNLFTGPGGGGPGGGNGGRFGGGQ